MTNEAKIAFKKWYSACRACVRDQRLARSHKAGSLRAERVFWAEHKDRIVFRHGYMSFNGLARVAGPMGAYYANREYWQRFNTLTYVGLRGVKWARLTVDSMRQLRAETKQFSIGM